MASASRTLRVARITSPLRLRGVHRPLASAAGSLLPAAASLRPSPFVLPARHFATTQPAVTSSLRDSSPNWHSRPAPPRETIRLDDDCDSASDDDGGFISDGFVSDGYGFTDDDIASHGRPHDDGCDREHWLVVMEPPPGDPSDPDVPRDVIIDYYIKVLSKVVGSEEKARQKIYSVSTRHYFAFGALVSEEISYKIKELPNVRWVLPDSYLDVENKDYGGEPFINGEAVPYDPKYHEEWVRNNARATARKHRHNDRLRSSRNFTRRRENMQSFQNRDDAAPGQGYNTSLGQNPMPPRDAPSMHHGHGNMPSRPPRSIVKRWYSTVAPAPCSQLSAR